MAVCLQARTAFADPNPFEAWARFISERRVYGGPLVPFPGAEPRPLLEGLVLCSALAPLCVHGAPTTPEPHLARVLAELEFAYAWLRDEGFALPYPDGGHGGTAEFDLYLVPDLVHGATSAADAPIEWAEFDAATTYALLDAALPEAALRRCTLSALGEAGLFGQDPAETESTRRALAAFATFLASGELGCEDAITAAQQAPELGLEGMRDEQVAATALWLAMLSKRHDKGTGRFMRDLWDLARQNSEDKPDRLHERPTFWQALSAALEKSGETLDDAVADLAVARYLAGRGQGTLPMLEPVPVVHVPPLASAPKHLLPAEQPLATYGSAYTRIDTKDAAPGKQLQVWLRAEPGVRWSLVAVRLSAAGKELGRVSAPARTVPESFIPLELTAETEQVLVVVTKLPPVPPIKRDPENDQHGFRLILQLK